MRVDSLDSMSNPALSQSHGECLKLKIDVRTATGCITPKRRSRFCCWAGAVKRPSAKDIARLLDIKREIFEDQFVMNQANLALSIGTRSALWTWPRLILRTPDEMAAYSGACLRSTG